MGLAPELKTIDLPAGVADAVYTGHAPDARAIAFVSEGRLFVTTQDPAIVYKLEPARGDTPPLVLAIAEELTEPRDTADVITLATWQSTH
jgi:hypothetical protein